MTGIPSCGYACIGLFVQLGGAQIVASDAYHTSFLLLYLHHHAPFISLPWIAGWESLLESFVSAVDHCFRGGLATRNFGFCPEFQ